MPHQAAKLSIPTEYEVFNCLAETHSNTHGLPIKLRKNTPSAFSIFDDSAQVDVVDQGFFAVSGKCIVPSINHMGIDEYTILN